MHSGGGGGGRECTRAALLTRDRRGQQLAVPFHQLNRNLVLRKTKFDPAVMKLWPVPCRVPPLNQKCFCNTGFL